MMQITGQRSIGCRLAVNDKGTRKMIGMQRLTTTRKISALLSALFLAGSAMAETVTGLPRIHGASAHPTQAGSVYFATNGGLFLAGADGQAERVFSPITTPATFVRTTPDGTLYAFAIDHGLIRGDVAQQTFESLFNGFGNQVPADLMIDAANPKRLHLLTQGGKVLASEDGGRTWKAAWRTPKPLSAEAAKGEALFVKHCQTCHGIEAVGETLSMRGITEKGYNMAPALNGSAHAWHHTDEALVDTILNGSTQEGARMKGFKEQLTAEDAKGLIAYFKSFWGQREILCQGAKHMNCPY